MKLTTNITRYHPYSDYVINYELLKDEQEREARIEQQRYEQAKRRQQQARRIFRHG